ncbi:hypothetical protein GW866_05455 [bacterium]|nr:hypothetical protein [bacterium]OIO83868.1 MAG: hypothetical protein AUK02_07445 [Anaerolineae bacterium CG2_30_58_95]
MKKIVLLAATAAFFALLACRLSSAPASEIDCAGALEALHQVRGDMSFPDNFQTENPAKQGGEFDANTYFQALTHLSMQPGYALDYVYHFDGMGGYPLLYPRPAEQAPFRTEADYAASGDSSDYLDYVQIDDTAEGYFQYVVLNILGSQFYLFWHANYNDYQIMCNPSDVRDIAASLGDFGRPMSLLSRLRTLLLRDVAPTVRTSEQSVEVQLVVFTKWGGFLRLTFSIDRNFPHRILDVKEKILVPYDCGVMF